VTDTPSQTPADRILENLFSVILDEARKRPDFAEKLLSALPQGAIARIERPERTTTTRASFDPNSFSLVAVMQTEGETGLRRRLNPLQRKQDIRAIAEAQHIPVDRAKFYNNRTKLQSLKDELIEGTRARISDRMAAAS